MTPLRRLTLLTSLLIGALLFCALLLMPGVVDAQSQYFGPRKLKAVRVDEGVALSWEAPAADSASVTGYQILRRRPYKGETDFLSVVADTGSTATSYTDTTATGPGQRYIYRVVALRSESNGVHDYSDDVSVVRCSASDVGPAPTAVEVTAVPIVVTSTTTDYFVLYVSHDPPSDSTVELPVLVKLGEAGTTTLAENIGALPKEHYRVEKYLVAEPADVDGDCVDDVTELTDMGYLNPVNPAVAVDTDHGTVAILDGLTFNSMARRKGPVGGGVWEVKFFLLDMHTDQPSVYFQNTDRHKWHSQFENAVGLYADFRPYGVTHGDLRYDENLLAPDGSRGLFVYKLSLKRDFFRRLVRSYPLLAASMPVLRDNLALHLTPSTIRRIQPEIHLLAETRLDLVFDEDIYGDTDYLALNEATGFGLLRKGDADDRPHPREVVIYEALPNELPRVAGIISTVPQTPLSHVNLRAVQNGIPNAFIRDALDDSDIDVLIDSYVRYEVTENSYSIRAATQEEVDAHYASSRPAQTQTPQRDLSATSTTSLSEIGFEDWDSFGVKAANLAVLGKLDFPDGTVPDGFAVPFYFYDEFMKANGLYDDIEEMLADEDFQTDFEEQADQLKDLRKAIKNAESPQWIIDALTEMHSTYPDGQSLRHRSSTNNEDLPGFNGAGLYDSKTQHPEETEEDGIDKSLKQVYASLWNFRAFTEREFHRIDHMAAAMGVLVHPNFSDELANGVAVSYDLTADNYESYYVNTQVGEDLVTNPDEASAPEEILLSGEDEYSIIALSNKTLPGQLLMSDAQYEQLRQHLSVIHDHFKGLYKPASDVKFAIEIEFKITSDDVLSIKQARPWVFNDDSDGAVQAVQAVALVGSLDQATAETIAGIDDDNSGANRFTTGDAEHDWALAGIRLQIKTWADGVVPTVALHEEGSDNSPGDLIATMTGPSPGAGVQTFTAPESTVLEPNRTYTVVVTGNNDSESDFELKLTTSNGEDTGAAVGWTIGNNSLRTSSGSWSKNRLGLKFAVVGRAVPTKELALSTTTLDISEGGSDSYTVVLSAQPTGDVTVTLDTGDGDVSADRSRLTFTPDDWDTPQSVEVTAAHDGDTDDDAATIGHTAAGGGYDDAAATLTVTVADDDVELVGSLDQRSSDRTAGIDDDTSAANRFTTGDAEHDWALAGIRLQIKTWADGVVPTVALHERGSGPTLGELIATMTSPSPGAGSRTFTVPAGTVLEPDRTYAVVVTGNNDSESDLELRLTVSNGEDAGAVEGWSIDNDSLRSSDGSWSRHARGLKFAVVGRAVPRRDLALSTTTLEISEGGSDSYTVALSAQPAGDVTVTLDTGDSDLSVDPTSLTFTPDDWNTPQSVEVTAGRDGDTDDDAATIGARRLRRRV